MVLEYQLTVGFQKFSVGSGLSHSQRKTPPKVGAIIVYRFQELTRDGVPRYVSYNIHCFCTKTEGCCGQVPNLCRRVGGQDGGDRCGGAGPSEGWCGRWRRIDWKESQTGRLSLTSH